MSSEQAIKCFQGNREAETAKNIQKREIAIAQLLTHVHDRDDRKRYVVRSDELLSAFLELERITHAVAASMLLEDQPNITE